MPDDVYQLAVALKRPNESLADVFRRWGDAARKQAFDATFGAWKMSDDEAAQILGGIYERRRTTKARGTPLEDL
jgi:predicted CopG family antitoxin